MKTKIYMRIVSSIIMLSMILCMNMVSFAKDEHNNNILSAEEIDLQVKSSVSVSATSQGSNVLKSFKGTYNGMLEIPFTVTDSSREVKILYACRKTNGATLTTHLGIRKSNYTSFFWTRTNLKGDQVISVGRLSKGNYVLRIKPGYSTDTYVIYGQVYYFI